MPASLNLPAKQLVTVIRDDRPLIDVELVLLPSKIKFENVVPEEVEGTVNNALVPLALILVVPKGSLPLHVQLPAPTNEIACALVLGIVIPLTRYVPAGNQSVPPDPIEFNAA